MRQRSLPGLCAAALASALALAACGGSSAPTAQARVPSTTIAPADPYAVPAHITTAYVQRVLNALNAVDGDATRLIVSNRALVKPALYRLEAIDSKSWFEEQTSTWTNDIVSGLSGYRTNPGDKAQSVTALLSGQPSCIFAKTSTDYSAVSSSVSAPELDYIQLVPKGSTLDIGNFNPTPWIIAVEGYNSHGLEPSDPCEKSS